MEFTQSKRASAKEFTQGLVIILERNAYPE